MEINLDLITETEQKILREIAHGATSKKVALDMGISERTVEKHRSHIIQKLGLEGGANSLTRWALINRNNILNL